MKKIVALFTLLAVLDRVRRQRRGVSPVTTSPRPSRTRTTAAGEAFGASGVNDDTIDCIAEAFHDSDLSDKALQAIVDGDEDFTGSKDDEDIASDEDFQGDIAKRTTG